MTDRGEVTVRVGSHAEISIHANGIRDRVFVGEQHVPAEIEQDGRDDDCIHALACLDGRPVATGRLAPDGKVGRVAVDREHRGHGLGRTIMATLEAEASRRGLARTWLHAQESAIGFYERIGYRRYGQPFREADIPHVAMEKDIRPRDPIC